LPNVCPDVSDGIADGIQHGIEDGIQHGIEDGIEDGIEHGIEADRPENPHSPGKGYLTESQENDRGAWLKLRGRRGSHRTDRRRSG